MESVIKHFTDLEAWKISHELVLMIYKTTQNFPRTETFGLTNQLRRAANSITANIAEGWGRYHFADKIKFFYQARGSNAEVQNFIILAKDLGYFDSDNYEQIMKKVFEGFKIINGLIRSTEKQK